MGTLKLLSWSDCVKLKYQQLSQALPLALWLQDVQSGLTPSCIPSAWLCCSTTHVYVPDRELICIQKNLISLKFRFTTYLYSPLYSLGWKCWFRLFLPAWGRLQKCRSTGRASSRQLVKLWQWCQAQGPAALWWPHYRSVMQAVWSSPQC